MCGICGIVYKDPEYQASERLIESMNDVQRHRGPDQQGVWTRGPVGLGHVRLSIIDLSPLGRQPMCNEDGTVWITFNGEIYNFIELRRRLQGKGHRFRSQSDSEVIVHLWEERGEQCLEDLCGMFALAIWDENTRTLFLGRDRMGKKPLFYADLPDRFIFASEIKAIMQDRSLDPAPDLRAIHYYLAYQSVPAPYCAFQGLNKLPAAHCLKLVNGSARPRRYWKLSYHDQFRPRTEGQLADLRQETVARLRQAVAERLVSDVPLGAFLSGGLDSSLVVALMSGLSTQPVKTFSISFEEKDYDEAQYARLVAQRYQTDHHEFVVRPQAAEILPSLVWHYNEPFADSSAIPTFYVSQLARRHVTVVLNGDGGDENFAGYTRYCNTDGFRLSPRWKFLLQRLSGRLGPWKPIFHTGGGAGHRRRCRLLDQRRLFYYLRITHFHEIYQRDLYTPQMLETTAPWSAVDLMLERYRSSDGPSFLDATLDLDFGLYLPDTLMTKVDVASMAHALEARSPMLDHRFIEFVAKIPAALKLKDGLQGKHLLKQAAEPFLPREVIYRPKMGFGVPLEHWFRHELKDMTHDLLLSARARHRGYFRPQYVEDMLKRHQSGESWQYLIWNLLMLELWHQMFIDGRPEPPAPPARVGQYT